MEVWKGGRAREPSAEETLDLSKRALHAVSCRTSTART